MKCASAHLQCQKFEGEGPWICIPVKSVWACLEHLMTAVSQVHCRDPPLVFANDKLTSSIKRRRLELGKLSLPSPQNPAAGRRTQLFHITLWLQNTEKVILADHCTSRRFDPRRAKRALGSEENSRGVLLIQGSANPRTPGSVNMRIKSCVLLPSAGRKTQLFILIFTEPGICGLADPCTGTLKAEVPVIARSLPTIQWKACGILCLVVHTCTWESA